MTSSSDAPNEGAPGDVAPGAGQMAPQAPPFEQSASLLHAGSMTSRSQSLQSKG